jgi:Arc/MetJ family transcription regulator
LIKTYIIMENRMASLKRKNFLVDEQALKRAQRILNAKTESDAVRQAISLVAFRRAVMRGYDRAAGKLPGFEAS